MATPTDRPSFDRKKVGLNPSQVRRAFWAWTTTQHGDGFDAKQRREPSDEEEGSTRHGNYRASKPVAGANRHRARVCYAFFVRDVGYANRARFVAFAKLKEHQKAGRRTLTEEVVEATWRARTA